MSVLTRLRLNQELKPREGLMKVLLAEDNILLREGLSLLIKSLFSDINITQVSDWLEFNQHIENNTPNIILISHQLAGSLSWRYNIKEASLIRPNSPICLIFDGNDSIDPRTAYQLGIKGSVNKETSVLEFQEMLIRMNKGGIFFKGYERMSNNSIDIQSGPHLTERQVEVLRLLKQGLSNKSISSALELSEGTVKQHLNRAYQALHVRNRVEAIHQASQLGLV